MNNVVLIGRLIKDPETRWIPESEKQVTTFTIAVDRPFAKEKTADFFRIVVFGKNAENCAKFLGKGKLCGVAGRAQNNNYETQSGEKRYTIEIIADRVEFLEPKKKQEQATDSEGNQVEGFAALDDDDDEIPF